MKNALMNAISNMTEEEATALWNAISQWTDNERNYLDEEEGLYPEQRKAFEAAEKIEQAGAAAMQEVVQ